MDLAGSSAIVTGGASGLGEATARALAAHGTRVVILDLNAELAEKVAAEVGGVAVVAEVADADQVSAAIRAAQEMGPLRVLVNSAGISRAQRTVGSDGSPFALEVFEHVLRTNLVGTFNCVRLAAAAMATQEPLETGERGSILNTASVAAFDGQIGQCAYAASKGGVVSLTLPLGSVRHPDLRQWRGSRGQEAAVGRERGLPPPARHRRRVRRPGPEPDHQLVHERRGGPDRRRDPAPAEELPQEVIRRFEVADGAGAPDRPGTCPRGSYAWFRSSRFR
jgi:NADP-dependent 3-hydroxy acid dehydrogenase YdfG